MTELLLTLSSSFLFTPKGFFNSLGPIADISAYSYLTIADISACR